jgi:hypothetical protein
MAMVQKAKPQNQSVQDLFDVYNFGLKNERTIEGSGGLGGSFTSSSSSGRVPTLLFSSPRGDFKLHKYDTPNRHA